MCMKEPLFLWDDDGNVVAKAQSKDEIVSVIDEVSKLNFKGLSIEEILAVLRKLKGYAFKLATVHASTPSSNLIYRVVKHNNIPRYTDRLSYPPKEYARQNRASCEGEQMFYGAFDWQTALFETNLQPKDRFVLSRWDLPSDIRVIGLGFSDEVFKLLKSRTKNFINVLSDHPYTNQDEIVMMHDFFAKCFCLPVPANEPEFYKLTIAVARYFSSNPRSEAMIYPSVVRSANAQNIVISKDLVDQGIIECNRVMYAEVVDIVYLHGELKYLVNIRDSADEFSPTGSIKWTGLRLHVDDDGAVAHGKVVYRTPRYTQTSTIS